MRVICLIGFAVGFFGSILLPFTSGPERLACMAMMVFYFGYYLLHENDKKSEATE